MVIGIDAREAECVKSGKAAYTFNLVKSLIEAHPECSFVLYSKEPLTEFARANVENIVINKRHIFWHVAVVRDWTERASKAPDCVYFAPTSFIVPALLPKRFTTVITVHDLIAFREQTHQRKAQIIERLFARRAAKNAGHIVVPSHNTARDLATLFPFTVGKIRVTPLGVEKKFFTHVADSHSAPAHDQSMLSDFKRVLPKQYILTVGGLEPRKNIASLIHAFLGLPTEFSEYRLVIVGGRGWHAHTTEELINKHRDRIMHLTDVSANELPSLYAQAKLFVFPSLYEGFGLPPLEAMAAGCPVICSNASSLPEVCGDAALLFNPENIDELREKIVSLLGNSHEQDKLRELGRSHAQNFTWQRCAEATRKYLSA